MSLVTDPDTTASTDPPSTAVRRQGQLRSALGWVAIVVAVIVFALFIAGISFTAPDSRGALDPESAKPSGSLALAELLRDQGVEVTVARTRAQVESSVSAGTTLVMADPYSLSDGAVMELIAPAEHTVFLSSATRLLRLLELGESAPAVADELTAECALAEFAHVGMIVPERFFIPATGVTGCYEDATGAAGVVVADRDGVRTVLVEASGLLSNEHLAENGNAALGLALLAQNKHVVWYVPSYADTDREAQSIDTLASLTPEWVTPAILLLLLAGIVAAISRGQRFGPLVAETLPVTVRASETMHGRARLTAKAADSAHAAAAVREGALGRIAKRLGLTARSSAVEIADAAADRLRISRGSLHELLTGALPDNDHDLIETTRRFAELESAIDNAVHVERNTP